MATTTAASASKRAPSAREDTVKRKQSFSDDSDFDSDSPSSSPSRTNIGTNSTGKISASQQLVPVPGQPDAPLVTKRTLQNRKAQREFRKRREARVRELEERCRRFDQMGLEANTELQRLARGLKDENEALKSLVARLGFAHMIPGVMDSLNGPEQQHHLARHPHDPNSGPRPHHHQQPFAPVDLGMDAWARGPGVAPNTTAPMHPFNAHANLPNNPTSTHIPASATKRSKQDVASTPSGPVSTTAPISSLAQLPALAELLPATTGGVNPSLLSDAGDKARKEHSTEPHAPTITAEATTKATTTARPIEDNNSTFDNDWFAQLAQSGHDKDDADVESALAGANTNNASMCSERPSINPILSLNFNKNTKANDSAHPTGSAMLGANARDFGLGLASALGLPPPSAPGSNIFPVPMPTQQNGALLNPNPIPFAFNLSENKVPGDQSWWSQVAGGALEGDDSILDEKAQVVAQATAASQNGAPSPFDLSAFLNGGLTPGGGGFTFGSQQSNDDPTNDAQKNIGAGNSNNDSSLNNVKDGEAQQLTQAEHAQMFLRLLESKMAKRSTSPYAQLGFQPPTHHQRAAAAQAGPSLSDAGSSASASSSNNASGAMKEDDDSPLSPFNVYSRLAQHPAFLSTNASELEELVDSIGSTPQRQQHQPLFQSPFNKRKNSPNKVAPTLYAPAGLTPSVYGPSGAAAVPSHSPSSSASSQSGKKLEVDENAVTKMLGMLDRKTSRNFVTVGSGLAF